jgi:hypothetical protein
MSLAWKAVAAWFILFAVMFANGAVRVALVQPRLGTDRARQLSSLTGLVLVLLVSGAFVHVSPEASSPQLWWVGLVWLAWTVVFEFLFGHFVNGTSWRALLADYNILRGRLWPIVLVGVWLGPWLFGVVSGRR